MAQYSGKINKIFDYIYGKKFADFKNNTNSTCL